MRVVLAVVVAAAVTLTPIDAAFASQMWTQDPICATPPATPTVANVTYSIPGGGSDPLTLNVYEPPGPGPYPSLIVVHGGSWKSGCKGQISVFAARFRDAGFAVFDIAYRTDCKPSNPPSTLDDPTYCMKVGVPFEEQDVKAAVGWVRSHAATYLGEPDHVAVFGDSSGGHVALLESAMAAGGSSAPDVVAVWSGKSELRVFADGTRICATFKCGALRGYIGCSDTACPAEWDANSPYGVVAGAVVLPPPTFLANATKEEAAPFQAAVDYDNLLGTKGVTHQLCQVDTSLHGLKIADLNCDGTSTTTFDMTVQFLQSHV